MNNMYIRRWLVKKFKNLIDDFRVIILTGARQTGKSTLLKNEDIFKNFKYFSFDDYSIIRMFKTSPQEILDEYDYLIIDEFQKFPEIMNLVKLYVDNSPQKHFILTGSSNVLLLKTISETLAGRAIYLNIFPFTLKEIEGLGYNEFTALFYGEVNEKIVDYDDSILLKGLMPKIVAENYDLNKCNLWFDGYVKTYIEKDIFDISKIQYLPDFHILLNILALNTGSILNESSIANQCNLKQPTAHRYINLLEILNIIYKIRPYVKNVKKRIVKSPKLYFLDCGLVRYLAGYYSEKIEEKFKGLLFENLFLSLLKVHSSLLEPEAKIYFYRDKNGNEIDFICEWGNRKIAFEVKYSKNVSIRDAETILTLKEELEIDYGYIIYRGNDVKKLSKSIIAIPIGYF